MNKLALTLCLLLLGSAVRADDPPDVQYQPSPCTLADKAISVCASIADDQEVAKARVYFRESGKKYFSYVEMAFGGINYCGTLPAPKEGKIETLEYYVQAVDSAYQSRRTSTYKMAIQAQGVCQFPSVEADPAKASSIVVYATHRKQGKKLPKDFLSDGVTFVPVAR